MKIGEFWLTLGCAAAVAALEALYAKGMSPLFALGIVGLSCAGYFALEAMKKAGLAYPTAEYVLVACSFCTLFIAGLSLFSLQYALSAIIFPLMFCISALLSLTRNFAAKLSG